MNIPFKVKLLTPTAKAPERGSAGDLWDLFADDFCIDHLQDIATKEIIDAEFDNYYFGGDLEEFASISNIREDIDRNLRDNLEDIIITRQINGGVNNYDGSMTLHPQARILVKTGIAVELPVYATYSEGAGFLSDSCDWIFESNKELFVLNKYQHAVADIRPRSGLALKHGITVLNTPGTIDNSYRKEIGVIIYNAGHQPYTIKKGDKIAQMLIRPLYPSSFEIVKDFEDTGRGGFGSTGR